MSELKVTRIEDLKEYAKGQVVELPPFAEGQPLVVRMSRPSMLAMVEKGRIPNSLLVVANKLFMGGSDLDTDNTDFLKDMHGVLKEICRSSLIEPTYEEFEDAGIRLTDDQIMAIFSYSQKGVKALESFRQKPGNLNSNWTGKGVPKNPGRNNKPPKHV